MNYDNYSLGISLDRETITPTHVNRYTHTEGLSIYPQVEETLSPIADTGQENTASQPQSAALIRVYNYIIICMHLPVIHPCTIMYPPQFSMVPMPVSYSFCLHVCAVQV